MLMCQTWGQKGLFHNKDDCHWSHGMSSALNLIGDHSVHAYYRDSVCAECICVVVIERASLGSVADRDNFLSSSPILAMFSLVFPFRDKSLYLCF